MSTAYTEPTTGRTSKHEARVRPSGEGFYAMVVRVDYDGAESTDTGFKARHFATFEQGYKACQRFITKKGLSR